MAGALASKEEAISSRSKQSNQSIKPQQPNTLPSLSVGFLSLSKKMKNKTNTLLHRLGNKRMLADEIQKHFPVHRSYIEPFFGGGGMFFNKPIASCNMVNDLDSDVFNLFQVVMNQKEELEKAFYMMPIHADLLKYWNKNLETDPIRKALRFLLLSNFTLLGKGVSLRTKTDEGQKKPFDLNIDRTFKALHNVKFFNIDFKPLLQNLSFRHEKDRASVFIYCDPPYLNTTDNYSSSFTEQDSIDLFDALQATKCKFAMSEFDNPFILDQAKQRGLNVIIIGERQNLKNRRTEILVTNYENTQLNLFS